MCSYSLVLRKVIRSGRLSGVVSVKLLRRVHPAPEWVAHGEQTTIQAYPATPQARICPTDRNRTGNPDVPTPLQSHQNGCLKPSAVPDLVARKSVPRGTLPIGVPAKLRCRSPLPCTNG